MRRRMKKHTFFLSVGVLLFLLFLFSLEMMTAYKRQLENERYKASLDAQIYSEILIKDLMVSQNASDTLDYIARDHEGVIHNFDFAASDLMICMPSSGLPPMERGRFIPVGRWYRRR